MLFNSYIFFVFLLVILPVYFLLPKKYKNVHLLISSYIFYGYWDWRFCFLLLLSTVVDFVIGKKLYNETKEKQRKRLLLLSMFVNLSILGFFKYFNFFVDSFSDMVSLFGGDLDFLHLNIILPVGISFYTFQTMSYTIDIYRKKLKPTNSILNFAVFVAFFPQLVAGPIEKAVNLLPQIELKPNPSLVQIRDGIILIVVGLFKKVMIGDTSGRIVDHIFGNPQYYKSPELLMGLVLFSVQIYADFSGYSHIARGTAKLLGLELMKNFEQPYLSSNITEFWRRWHISLSSWLRDYLYISLGGNRISKSRTYINLMTTMLLGGLWHGANWTFIIWGGLHGIYLAVHKLMLGDKKVTDKFVYNGMVSFFNYLLKALLTYVLVLLTWLFFRASDVGNAFYVLNKIFAFEYSELWQRTLTISLTYISATLLIDILEYYYKSHVFLLKIKSTAIRNGIMTAIVISVMVYMFQAEPESFIYFQF